MKINPKVVSDRFEDEVVIVNLESGIYYSLRGDAVDVWASIENGISKSMISNHFIAPSEAELEKINHFIDFIIEENLAIDEDNLSDGFPQISSKTFTKLEYSKFDDMADLIMIDPIHEVDDKKGWPNKPTT